MRALAATALAAGLFAAPAAFAAEQPQVSITIGADLQKKAEQSYGTRELEDLKTDLAKSIARAYAKASATPAQRVEVVIESATPNRPTFKQLGRVGLSLGSIGLGGATLTGQVTGADGVAAPVSYNWYETDIRNEWAPVTWTDAYRAFDNFAARIARGDRPNQPKYTPDRYAGDFGRWMR